MIVGLGDAGVLRDHIAAHCGRHCSGRLLLGPKVYEVGFYWLLGNSKFYGTFSAVRLKTLLVLVLLFLKIRSVI